MKQWGVSENPIHVCPLDDLKEHELDMPLCWCNPEVRSDMTIHNAADGREWNELANSPLER